MNLENEFRSKKVYSSICRPPDNVVAGMAVR
jgi:hypothetical protein